ncbi:hypothetical protein ACJMK2_026216 [Sinanodonta woodiana]|uniref:RRM domain-containing protein n=2 Tax=Sinanodonta woodiana TaxID=1069815 RepID=A0ABD3XMD1_SINWO
MAESNPDHYRIVMEEHSYAQDGELFDYMFELGSDEEVNYHAGKQILRMEQSDSDGTLKESSDLQKMLNNGIDESVAVELLRFFKIENISFDNLDEAARDAIKGFSLNDVNLMISLVLNSDVEFVVNRSAYLIYQMEIFIRNKSSCNDLSGSLPGPDKEKLRAIVTETGYPLDIIPGHRRYGGPPPNYEGRPPPHGHELSVSGISKDWFEDKLIPLFQKYGKLYEIRLPINTQTGYNNRYCFVSYCKKKDADLARGMVQTVAIRPGKTLRANISNTKTCLYVENIPRDLSEFELQYEFEKITPGIYKVIVINTPEMLEFDFEYNKGFCFIEYDDHKQALAAKTNLERGWYSLFGYDIIVDWAELQDEPDEEFMAKVKIVYVDNLSIYTKLETVKIWFERYGKVEKVHLGQGCAFVYFEKREDALAAIQAMNGRVYGRYHIRCFLSKSHNSSGKQREKPIMY